ncbi:MAG: hypothetical protein H7062_21475, partial [Candidatus Saccharimonas sp.]|nr:hypothetical protein [Planctomycetaceae bacterium]
STVRPASETFRSRSVPLFARSDRSHFKPRRPTFELRLVVDSDDEPVRLIETDQTPTLPGVATLENLEEKVADDDDLIVPPKPLSDVAVPIDGAAEKAERTPKGDETKMANNHFSLGGLVGDGDKLGILELESKALPTTTIEEGHSSRFDVNFGYAIRWLTGPVTTDLPPQLFTLQLDIGWAFKLGEKLTIDTRITPTWNTDFEKSTEIFRLPWHAIAVFQADTNWRWTLGAMDLDREDIHVLPVVGLTFAPPDGDVLLDLVFPRPKAALRLSHDENHQHWFYVAGELGGGSWAINRTSGARDIVTLRDLRLLVGLETVTKKRHASRLEAGWVFDRVVDYRSNLGDYRPSDTAIIRWSSDF